MVILFHHKYYFMKMVLNLALVYLLEIKIKTKEKFLLKNKKSNYI